MPHDELYYYYIFDDEGVGYALVQASDERKAMGMFYKRYPKSFPDGCLRIRRLDLGQHLVIL